MKQSRFIALLLSLALLCALCGCVTAPAVSEPESEPTTTAATAGTTTTATEPETTTTTHDPYYPYDGLYSTEKEARAAYEACKKMSYEEYFSEPRVIFSYFYDYRDVLPKRGDPTVLCYESEPNRIYFDAKKYKKDAKEVRSGGYDGDGIIDYFCVDDEIWRWHIPSDTMDVVVKDHGLINGIFADFNDFGYCTVYHPELGDEGNMDAFVYEHYHVFSKNLVIPYKDVPEYMPRYDLYQWFQKNVYNKK